MDQLNKRVDFLKDHQTPLLDFATSKTRFKTSPQKNEPGEKEGEGTKTQNPKGRDPNHKCEPRDPKGNPPPPTMDSEGEGPSKTMKNKNKKGKNKGRKDFPNPQNPQTDKALEEKGEGRQAQNKRQRSQSGVHQTPKGFQPERSLLGPGVGTYGTGPGMGGKSP